MAGKGCDTRDTRLRKSGADRIRRQKTHVKRLLALGITQDALKHMTSAQIRQELHKLTAREQRAV